MPNQSKQKMAENEIELINNQQLLANCQEQGSITFDIAIACANDEYVRSNRVLLCCQSTRLKSIILQHGNGRDLQWLPGHVLGKQVPVLDLSDFDRAAVEVANRHAFHCLRAFDAALIPSLLTLADQFQMRSLRRHIISSVADMMRSSSPPEIVAALVAMAADANHQEEYQLMLGRLTYQSNKEQMQTLFLDNDHVCLLPYDAFCSLLEARDSMDRVHEDTVWKQCVRWCEAQPGRSGHLSSLIQYIDPSRLSLKLFVEEISRNPLFTGCDSRGGVKQQRNQLLTGKLKRTIKRSCQVLCGLCGCLSIIVVIVGFILFLIFY